MRKTLTVAAAAACTLTLGLTAAPASADITALDITAIGYNAYGADTAANRNQEYVDVKNVAATPVNVKDLLVQDAWARGRDKTRGCNTFRLAAGKLPVATGQPADELPAGAVLRIHMGAGTAAIDARGVRHVYANMPTRCGYNGHVLNNGPGSSKFSDWDRVWVTLGSEVESRGYNFSFGYVAK